MLPTSLEIFIARAAKKKFKFLSPSIEQPYLRFLISIVKGGEFDKSQTKNDENMNWKTKLGKEGRKIEEILKRCFSLAIAHLAL